MDPIDWELLARQAEFRPRRLALLCEVSERQLQRLFQQQLRCTPQRWLRSLRCRLAKDLIIKGYTNKAAAADLKFADETHFCREFKKEFGIPPHQFAQKHLLNVLLQSMGANPG